MKSKRTLIFHPPAEATRKNFLTEYGENARNCLDWLEQETRLAPEDGNYIGGYGQRFVLTIEVDTKGGTFRCRVIYIFNDTAVKWLMFSYKFIPHQIDIL